MYKDGVRKKIGIHQLVANEFVKKHSENLVINHIDENKTNNIYSNLEWVSVKDNTNHGTAIIRRAMTQGKKVRQFLENGEFVNEFYSTGEAERQTGIDHSYISMCANGKVRTAKGFIWKYV
nr:HNH endonuclease [Lactococcus hircilactis]